MKLSKPHAIIIGAGFTGCATAHDLTQRGFNVTVLERGEIASGTSGRTHGLLHSGARYCVTDQEAAVECIEENILLRKIAKQCIEFNGGLFLALNDEDMAYAPAFEAGAQASGIPFERLSGEQALALEPAINPRVLAAYRVPDGSFDPLRLALAFAATARQNGAVFKTYHNVEGVVLNGTGKVLGLKVWDRASNQRTEFLADIVISATGAWAGNLFDMANTCVEVTPTPGVMVAFDQRPIQRPINRLNEPGDGDILLPQRRMTVIGTTSFETSDPDYIPVFAEQVKEMERCARELVPCLGSAHQRGAYMSARPLIGSAHAGRSLSRTFQCFDHLDCGGPDGMVTITGGKATTCRAMAEKVSDLVCGKLGIVTPCRTRETVLASYREYYR